MRDPFWERKFEKLDEEAILYGYAFFLYNNSTAWSREAVDRAKFLVISKMDSVMGRLHQLAEAHTYNVRL